jgi:hypothetical protein
MFSYDVPIAEVIQRLMRWMMIMIDEYERIKFRNEAAVDQYERIDDKMSLQLKNFTHNIIISGGN